MSATLRYAPLAALVVVLSVLISPITWYIGAWVVWHLGWQL